MLEGSIFLAIAGSLLLGAHYLLQVLPHRCRAAALRRAAAALGFAYAGDGDPFAGAAGFARQHLNLLWAHQADTFRHGLRGPTAAGPALVFDHAYKRASGDAEHDRVIHTVVAFHLPGADLPQFTLEPYGLIRKVASVFGRPHLAFTGHPRFSNDYELRGPDERAVRALFGPGLLDRWEALPGGEGWATCCARPRPSRWPSGGTRGRGRPLPSGYPSMRRGDRPRRQCVGKEADATEVTLRANLAALRAGHADELAVVGAELGPTANVTRQEMARSVARRRAFSVNMLLKEAA